MIPYGIVSAQRLPRPAPFLAESIVLDFVEEVYTVDGTAVSPFDLIDGLLETHLTADGLGNRSSSDFLTAKGALFDLLQYGIKNSLQLFFDWKIASGSANCSLVQWESTGTSTTWVFLDSLADYGFNLYQWPDLTIDVSTGAGTGYNGSFSATNTMQRGGAVLGMQQTENPSRRYYGLALNDAASAQNYLDGILPTETISTIRIGCNDYEVNTNLVIARIVVERLAFDYSQLADFSDLTASP